MTIAQLKLYIVFMYSELLDIQHNLKNFLIYVMLYFVIFIYLILLEIRIRRN